MLKTKFRIANCLVGKEGYGLGYISDDKSSVIRIAVAEKLVSKEEKIF